LITLHLKSHNKFRCINTKGKLNHLKGYALRGWHSNGQLWWGEYWVDGKLHKPKGPAYKAWHENGQLWREEYWLKGKQVHNFTFKNAKLG